jgi:hypothetical protein
MYGGIFEHDQLNRATHDALHEHFGVANLSVFAHLARTPRRVSRCCGCVDAVAASPQRPP